MFDKCPSPVNWEEPVFTSCLAEAVRFELTNGFPLPVFKTGAIDHSATLPFNLTLAMKRLSFACHPTFKLDESVILKSKDIISLTGLDFWVSWRH